MELRRFGSTDMELSVLGLGGLLARYEGALGHPPPEEKRRIYLRAAELGINLFDTAADYSDSEAILGRALTDTPRDQYFVATKFSPTTEADQGGSIIAPQQVIESCERSLKRLRIEEIDVFQFHGVLPENYRECIDQLFPAAERLKTQGKIRFIGVTEAFIPDPQHAMLKQALEDDCESCEGEGEWRIAWPAGSGSEDDVSRFHRL